MKGVFFLLFIFSVLSAFARPNVLFIAVDDLRPQLNCYGKSRMQTPHLDRLAERGVLFERAYCMVPTCGASRASLMTGIRPAEHRFVNYLAWAEKDAPGVTTLNTHFKNHGYTTVSIGKVFHHRNDSLNGWSEKPWRSSLNDYQLREFQQRQIKRHREKYPQRKKVRGMPYESADASDDNYRDGANALKAIETLERFSQNNKEEPFFMALGFHKPHLPFTAPKKYWDLYDVAEIELPNNYFPPEGAPPEALHSSGELRAYSTIPPTGPVDRKTALNLIHGYYACVSFVDAQIGKVLDSLRRLGLADETLVILWGDHGWQLGEHGMWNKHSCFETSMHAPLMVLPPKADGVLPGSRVSALIEFIDIYPSLCDLAGIPKPDHLEGRSFLSLMKNPDAPWKSFAIGRYKKGDTIRSNHFRFSEYTGPGQAITGSMLYDHRSDSAEIKNVVGKLNYARDVEMLKSNLHSHKGR
ncbi:MAG TPA: DUF229 domain-containing protein, partial [Verrucomicrobia bacterium]|nr:DUF229 domain-containing protein [Verrucomicrobiota bacterium]